MLDTAAVAVHWKTHLPCGLIRTVTRQNRKNRVRNSTKYSFEVFCCVKESRE